jgi:hypothetical protein
MAVFVPCDRVVKVDFRGTLDGERISNTLYVQKQSGSVNASDLQNIGQTARTWWGAELSPTLSSAFVLREIYLTDLTQQNSFVLTYTTNLPASGQLAGSILPNNVTFCISLRTGNAGRSFRGRNYVPGIRSTDVTSSDPNLLSVGRSNTLVAAYQQLINPTYFGTTPYRLVIVSRFSNGNPRTAGIATPVTAVLAVDRVLDSMRRRLPGRGQ